MMGTAAAAVVAKRRKERRETEEERSAGIRKSSKSGKEGEDHLVIVVGRWQSRGRRARHRDNKGST
jgi:hypothetical protein